MPSVKKYNSAGWNKELEFSKVAMSGSFEDLEDKPVSRTVWSETSSSTTVRTVTIDGVGDLNSILNVPLFIKAATYGTASASTLNINGLGAKNIYFPSLTGSGRTTTPPVYYWVRTSQIYCVVWDGSYFVLLNMQVRNATTSYYGLTKYTDSVSSESTDTAATPNSVKKAYDLADTANTAVGTAQSTADNAVSMATTAQTALNAKADASVLTSHTSNTSNPHSVTKAQAGLGSVENYGIATQTEAEAGTSSAKYMTPLRVFQAIAKWISTNLGNVNNTSDANKPVSTATQTALNAKEPTITAGTSSQYWSGTKAWVDFATAVRATVLTGLSTATSTAVAAADSILTAIGKLQAQITFTRSMVDSAYDLAGAAYNLAGTAGSLANGKVSKSGDTVSGKLIVEGDRADISYTSDAGQLEARSSANVAAAITFHRAGAYAVNFGLDTDNQLKLGGYSMGAVAYEILHMGNISNIINGVLSATSSKWDTGTSYFKINVQGITVMIMYGSIRIGNTDRRVSVSFPTGFSYAPRIFLNPVGSGGESISYKNLYNAKRFFLDDVTKSNFIVGIPKTENVIPEDMVMMNWLAIGV